MRSSGRGRGRMELRRRGEEEDEKQIIAAITLHSFPVILYTVYITGKNCNKRLSF